MRVAFRTDASIQIGTGHVMRCLTLAGALAEFGAECHFLCRGHEGNLIEIIRAKGYRVHVLDESNLGGGRAPLKLPADTTHSAWLGTTQTQDVNDCTPILAALCPDWVIVDHYALDALWEREIASNCDRIMVIDDLADRSHACDLLLDQSFGRAAVEYRSLVPASCQLLCGSHYAVLRPEFPRLRSYSLGRRAQPQLRQLLVTLGGVDKDNYTGRVLDALRHCVLPTCTEITVVMGITAPWRAKVEQQARSMPWSTRVCVGVGDMAKLMAESDVAIGAAGATSWERCCLGVPTIMFVLARNQRKIAQALSEAGAADLHDIYELNYQQLITQEFLEPRALDAMSAAAAAIVDGLGAHRVVQVITDNS